MPSPPENCTCYNCKKEKVIPVLNGYYTTEDKTPLMVAAESNYLESVKIIINFGACASIISTEGKTAKQYATDNGHTDVANFISLCE